MSLDDEPQLAERIFFQATLGAAAASLPPCEAHEGPSTALLARLQASATTPGQLRACREELHLALHGNPNKVTLCTGTLRALYLCTACLEARLALNLSSASPADILQALDVAQMLCPPHPLLSALIAFAQEALGEEVPPELPCLFPEAVARVAAAAELAGVGQPLPHLDAPSLAAFAATALQPPSPRPCRIRGALAHWPALATPAPGAQDRRWCRLAYLWRAAGKRTVPIEVGGSGSGGYLAPAFALQLTPLSVFLETVVAPSVREFLNGAGASREATAPPAAAYLAQHALLDFVPSLGADIGEPDYIACATNEGDGGHVSAKAWLGPLGTYTNFHNDPTHNLLAQVVGVKRVRLFPPQAAAALRPAPPPLQNTATLPRETFSNPALVAAFPFPMLETVLHPGDMAFIPKGWWHEVEALTPSFSVSFWW
jgi:hypothetical protein